MEISNEFTMQDSSYLIIVNTKFGVLGELPKPSHEMETHNLSIRILLLLHVSC